MSCRLFDLLTVSADLKPNPWDMMFHWPSGPEGRLCKCYQNGRQNCADCNDHHLP